MIWRSTESEVWHLVRERTSGRKVMFCGRDTYSKKLYTVQIGFLSQMRLCKSCLRRLRYLRRRKREVEEAGETWRS